MGTAYQDDRSYDNAYVNALVDGLRWTTGDTVGFWFDPTGGSASTAGGIPAIWQEAGAGAAFLSAAAAWNAVANVTLAQVSTRATADYVEAIYSDAGDDTLGEHYLPNSEKLGGRFNAGHWIFTAENNARGGYSYVTFLHELGHALGLDHPFDGAEVFPGVTQDDDADSGDYDLNQQLWTVMSYNDVTTGIGDPGTEAYGWAETPMAFDIAAVQALYGANMTTATGDDTYLLPSRNEAGTGFTCIWDAGGTDTLSGANTQGCTIDLHAATLKDAAGGGGVISRADLSQSIYGGFTIAHGVTIENAIGSSGSDTLIGNDAANRLDGNGGDDTMTGGGGADTFVVDLSHGNATVTDFDAAEDHLLISHAPKMRSCEITGFVSSSFELEMFDTKSHYHYLNLTGELTLGDLPTFAGASVRYAHLYLDNAGDTLTGTALDDAIDGGRGADVVDGAAGNDTLTGGAGKDRLSGGDGVDFITGDAGSDRLSGGDGNDTIEDQADGDDRLSGDAGDDFLYVVDGAVVGDGIKRHGDVRLDGGAGNDQLSLGGAMTGALLGGDGDDTYDLVQADPSKLTLVEAANAGTDTVAVTSSFTLAANFENLSITGDGEMVGTGNAQNNTITSTQDRLDGTAGLRHLLGLGGNDVLVGAWGSEWLDGGTGADVMSGSFGDDTYVVDDPGDRITEVPYDGIVPAGLDRVFASVNYALPDYVEYLTLTGGAAIDGKGNRSANHIAGNDAANVIRGEKGDDSLWGEDGNDTLDGGSGADTMKGGHGDDLYRVDNVHDQVIEKTGQGTDTVEATVSWTLGAAVETLRLEGSGALDGRGNDLANRIEGNDAANRLSGGHADDSLAGGGGDDTLSGDGGDDVIRGGAGRDVMSGGSGHDRFVFKSGDAAGLAASTADRITDFQRDDVIDLSAIDPIAGKHDDAFRFLGGAAFDGKAAALRVYADGGDTFVSCDFDGDRHADLLIRLDGEPTVTAVNFIL